MICAPVATPTMAPSNKTVVIIISEPLCSFGAQDTQPTGPAIMLSYASSGGGSGQNYIICS